MQAEIETLGRLEALAAEVRRGSRDTKWRELAGLLGDVFTPARLTGQVGEPATPYGAGPIPRHRASPRQKLVVFTEHRDTLRYLRERMTTLLGREDSVVVIHGGVGREQRLAAQEAFRHDPRAQVLLATDAAGEGINLQRAHLMVNYDLPWNPNRLEQRFGRIHRIGQTEVCHLWNLVAGETREGDVYRRLLEKLEQARQTLGGQVFDVLGKLEFEGRPLRDLLLDAVRYGERPEVRARLDTAVDQALDRSALQDLLEERQLHRARAAGRRRNPRRGAAGDLLAHALRRARRRRRGALSAPCALPRLPAAAGRRPGGRRDPRPAGVLVGRRRPGTACAGARRRPHRAGTPRGGPRRHARAGGEDRGGREGAAHQGESTTGTTAPNGSDWRSEAGRTGARLNSGEARRRADALQLRLRKRLAELQREARIAPRPPVVLGGLLVVPRGLLAKAEEPR